MAVQSFSEQLERESDAWVADGVITAEQAAALRSRYAGAARLSESRSRATVALATVGALAVGFGVIGFFAANWDGLSHALRLLLLTGATAGAYAGAYHVSERTADHPRVGEALYLLGVILFGSSLFLVGQMYNVQAHDPFALLLWAGGATATAFVVRSRPLAWVALLIFTGWVGFEFGLALDDAGGDALTAFPGLAFFYGAVLYGLGTAAGNRIRSASIAESGFAGGARPLGFVIGAGALFVLTFAGATDEIEHARDDLHGVLLAAFFVLAGVALASAAVLALTRRPSARSEAAAIASVIVVLVVAVLAGGGGTLYAIVFNLLFAGVALGAIYVGYQTDEPWLVNLGVALVAIDLIARYFDVFWDALPRSVGMIGAGALVLGIAYVLERQRKQLLDRMAA